MSLVATLMVLAALSQAGESERARAVDLARRGRTAEAIQLFQALVARDPSDVDARLWVARLDMRMGRLDQAEAAFRAVHETHPEDVDARIGLGAVLTRKGDVEGALAVLEATEKDAPANADLLSALALAQRRYGDDAAAMRYYTRALALAPADTDIRDGYETLARTYGHGIAVEGFAQHVGPDTDVGAGSLLASVRAGARVHLQGELRTQSGPGYLDVLGGGGILWRALRTTNVTLRASGGSDNSALANRDLGAELLHYRGPYEIGASVRGLSFAGAGVTAVSPIVAIDRDRWRTDARYTYSHVRFTESRDAKGDHSVFVRCTWRHTPRLWSSGTYAYGIESFEDLTADRVASLGAHTAAAGVRLNLHSLTVVNATWEHQWRSNDTRLDRLTVSIAQFFP